MVMRSLLLVGAVILAVLMLGPVLGRAVQDIAEDGPPTEPVVEAPIRSAPRSAGLGMDSSGHYRATALINGGTVMMIVDTGASTVVLTENDARAVGIIPSPSHYTGRARTAAGEIAVAPVTIERISVNGIERRNIAAVVAQGTALPVSLLGQTFLSTLHEVRMGEGRMTLTD